MQQHVNRETDIHFLGPADKYRKMKKLQGIGAVLSDIVAVILWGKKRIVRGSVQVDCAEDWEDAGKKDRATYDMGTASLTGRKSVQTMRTSRFEQFHCGTHWLNLYVQGEIIKH